ncbi:MAG: hypothetical protein GY820_36500 [Gammaproteobacteria bacterium]|nr:hypothetical protein [Gammaproteobacteria bacterium]
MIFRAPVRGNITKIKRAALRAAQKNTKKFRFTSGSVPTLKFVFDPGVGLRPHAKFVFDPGVGLRPHAKICFRVGCRAALELKNQALVYTFFNTTRKECRTIPGCRNMFCTCSVAVCTNQ